MNSPAIAIQYLEKSNKALKERNKILRTADKYCWNVLDEYIDHPITEGADNATKLRQADYGAKAKRQDKVKALSAHYIPEPEIIPLVIQDEPFHKTSSASTSEAPRNYKYSTGHWNTNPPQDLAPVSTIRMTTIIDYWY